MKKLLISLIMVLFLLIPLVKGDLVSMLIGLIFLGSFFFWSKQKQLDWLLIIVSGAGLFCIYALTLLWTENIELGLSNLETKLSLLIIPISLNLIGPFDEIERRNLYIAFLTGLVVSVFYHTGVSAQQWAKGLGNSVFFYANLTKEFHPSYLAMYFTVGIAILMFDSKNFITERWHRILKGVLLCLFSGFIILISSRTGIICLAGLILALVVKILIQKTYRELAILPLIILTIGLTFSMPQGKDNRVLNTLSEQIPSTSSQSMKYRNSSESRLIAWKSSLEIIYKNKAGVGVGDAQGELVKSYEQQGETYLVSKNLNSHNQFLTTGLAIGLFGIVMLLILFFGLGIKALNQKNWLLAAVAVIILVNFMTESMLERASGTVFISLILSLVLFRKN